MKFTRKQVEAIYRKWQQSPDGSPSYLHFRRRWQQAFGGYVGAQWCGMWLGIEPDGYAHS